MLTQFDKTLAAESGANLAGVNQTAALIVNPDEESAQPGPRSGWIGEAADDKLLIPDTLGFDPVATSPRPIRLVDSFGNHPFESRATSFIVKAIALP